MKKRIKKCIQCGVQLHPTDWIILKEMSKLPVCDLCEELIEHENSKIHSGKLSNK